MVDSLAIIMSYCPTASNKRNGIIVLLKTPTKYQEFSPTLFVKTTDFQLVYNFEQTSTVSMFGEHGIIAQIEWWLSQSERSKIALPSDSVFNKYIFLS